MELLLDVCSTSSYTEAIFFPSFSVVDVDDDAHPRTQALLFVPLV
jgi:hypothetical protein